MQPFTYAPAPTRVIFGRGTVRSALAAELRLLRCTRALFVTGSRGKATAEQIESYIPADMRGGIFTGAAMHTPEEVTQKALAYAESTGADVAVAIGGGSCIGLSKALALYTEGRIKQIVIPTTYAGSEATSILGETKNGIKTTQSKPVILPQTIIYDVDLTMTLPSRLSSTSGINAIAHAVEALYAKDLNPVIELMALQGIETLAKALPRISQNPTSTDARSDALYGAWLCGTCLGASSMALHHKICHTLGGSFGMPHSETHTVILPHAIEYNAPYIVEASKKIAKALGVSDAAQGIYDLAKQLGAPLALEELGYTASDIRQTAELAYKASYPNPAPLEVEKLVKMLEQAFAGMRPGSMYQ